jgi:quercetin dioxygenase-like cupin family protein
MRAMPERNRKLQHFINAVETAIRARARDFPDAMAMTDRIFTALQDDGGAETGIPPCRLPVCDYLEQALDQARGGPISEFADAFAGLEPQFAWSRRPESAQVGADFYDNHANAVIVGDHGLEERGDVRIGVSLVAPGVHYPRHHHPPEELYAVLSSGKWMQNDNPLVAKQSGDLVHNLPNAWHAMQAMETAPLLAVWCLWTG